MWNFTSAFSAPLFLKIIIKMVLLLHWSPFRASSFPTTKKKVFMMKIFISEILFLSFIVHCFSFIWEQQSIRETFQDLLASFSLSNSNESQIWRIRSQLWWSCACRYFPVAKETSNLDEHWKHPVAAVLKILLKIIFLSRYRPRHEKSGSINPCDVSLVFYASRKWTILVGDSRNDCVCGEKNTSDGRKWQQPETKLKSIKNIILLMS